VIIWPHFSQYPAVGSISAPHKGQGITILAPHAVQKRLPVLSGCPQFGQLTVIFVASTLCCALPNLPEPQSAAQFGQ
jgi:hypothetical protein